MSPWRMALRTSAWIALGTLSLPASALAQAWVGDRNGLNLSLDYSFSRSDRVITDYDLRDLSPTTDLIDNHNLSLGVEFVPLERLGLQASIPVITTLYHGQASAFPTHGRYDDGSYHTVLQDFRFTARYMVLDGLAPVTVSPHLGFSIPMTDYETVGYAGAGRGLKQLHAGLSLGKYFSSGVPDLYLHGLYEFTLSERYETAFEETAEFGQNRSDIKLLVGYFITDKLEVNAAADVRLPHGGLEFVEFEEVGRVVQNHHDALLAERLALVGAGVSYQLLDKLRLAAIVRVWVWGENTRDLNLVGVNASYDIM